MRSVQAFVGALWICAIGILSAQSVLRKHYAAPGACGFTFDYPADWVASATGSTGDCRVRVRPLDFDDLKQDGGEDSYTLEVGREQGDFLEAASKNLFDFVRGRWIVRETPGLNADATVVNTDRWHGLRGDVTSRCFIPSLGAMAVCEKPALVLRDDDDNIWSMMGGPQTQEPFDAILETFRFVAR